MQEFRIERNVLHLRTQRTVRLTDESTVSRPPHSGTLQYIVVRHTVLVTLLISDTNSTAYPTLIYGLYLPYGSGVGLRGLGWRFLTLTERALKE